MEQYQTSYVDSQLFQFFFLRLFNCMFVCLVLSRRCAGPEDFAGQLVSNLTSDEICYRKSSGKNTVILAIAIPIVIICVLLIGYYIYKIVQSRRSREDRKSVRYSSVYKDTTEATPKGHSPGGGAPTSVL